MSFLLLYRSDGSTSSKAEEEKSKRGVFPKVEVPWLDATPCTTPFAVSTETGRKGSCGWLGDAELRYNPFFWLSALDGGLLAGDVSRANMWRGKYPSIDTQEGQPYRTRTSRGELRLVLFVLPSPRYNTARHIGLPTCTTALSDQACSHSLEPRDRRDGRREGSGLLLHQAVIRDPPVAVSLSSSFLSHVLRKREIRPCYLCPRPRKGPARWVERWAYSGLLRPLITAGFRLIQEALQLVLDRGIFADPKMEGVGNLILRAEGMHDDPPADH